MHEVLTQLADPKRLYVRSELLGRASMAPKRPGIYDWYDNQTLASLQAAAKRLERGATFDAAAPRVPPPVCHNLSRSR